MSFRLASSVLPRSIRLSSRPAFLNFALPIRTYQTMAPQSVTISGGGKKATVPTGLFIGNEWVPGRGKKIVSHNPADETVIAEVDSVRSHLK